MFKIPPVETIQSSGHDYLFRWYLSPWSFLFRNVKFEDTNRIQRFVKLLPKIYLHKFVADDDDRAMHDHPWPSASIILCGGYIEYKFITQPKNGAPLPIAVPLFRQPGRFYSRKADEAHRIQLVREQDNLLSFQFNCICYKPPVLAWTIFITWSKAREWGFWCTEGDANSVRGLVAKWVHQRDYFANGGCE